jgi:hypothetical protein
MPRFSYELRKIDAILHRDQRIETGPVQINDDWPGVFIRGDNAMFYAMALKSLLNMLKDEKDLDRMLAVSPLYGLAELLASCNVNNLRKDEDDRNQA